MVVTGARAADAIVAAGAEPMDYVRVCDAFGTGYFYIPGTETCLKIGGYVRFDSNYGEDPYSGESNGWDAFTRGTITLDARSDSEFGTWQRHWRHRSSSAQFLSRQPPEIVSASVNAGADFVYRSQSSQSRIS
jgi:hypothetical protein